MFVSLMTVLPPFRLLSIYPHPAPRDKRRGRGPRTGCSVETPWGLVGPASRRSGKARTGGTPNGTWFLLRGRLLGSFACREFAAAHDHLAGVAAAQGPARQLALARRPQKALELR